MSLFAEVPKFLCPFVSQEQSEFNIRFVIENAFRMKCNL